ncbi:MAG: ABC transporter substrate-binding protein, partial [Clostridiales bacterium]|nr:ABC transporter substrate-binding protein [Clostridiales bacterium]
RGTSETQRYGITGWFATQIIQQTGKTMVTNNNGVFTSNLNDPDIARAEELLYSVAKDKLVYADWVGSAKDCFSMKNILFYSMGTWAMTGTAGPQEGDDWRVVPVPTDPNSDGQYMTSDMAAYMWVKGSTKNEAVKCWFECSRVAEIDPQYRQDGKDKFFISNPNWTEEMYQVFVDSSSEEYTQVFDFSYGISPKFSDDNSQDDQSGSPARNLYEFVTKSDDEGVQQTWTQVKTMYSSMLDTELSAVNKAISEIK